ncbi:carbonic anhydrase [Patulibacter defluvii]|uniref:carbonic anhydrase n=1 Tax=Patulibacter defluvii TaxID=3095358 RepID=UPI002A750248|nr:carbonic anhydrase [Patulibacter sp. DM4]
MTPSWAPFGRTGREDDPTPTPMPAAAASHGALPRAPRRSLAVITCMDARIDPLAGFGLALGDAHVLRNAGAEATDDVLRSLRISHDAAGTREVWVVGHTDCLAHGSDDLRVEESLRRSLERITALTLGFRVRTFRYHLGSGWLEELSFPPGSQAAAAD